MIEGFTLVIAIVALSVSVGTAVYVITAQRLAASPASGDAATIARLERITARLAQTTGLVGETTTTVRGVEPLPPTEGN